MYLITASFAITPICFASSFTDVPQSHPRYQEIEYVKEHGIFSGYSDGTFRPDNTINRAELVKILVETFSENEIVENCDGKFSDVFKNDWFEPYVCKAQLLGLVQGYADGSFRPENPINVAEAAKIFTNAIFYIKFPEPGIEVGNLWFLGYVRGLDLWPISIRSFDQSITRGDAAYMIAKYKNKGLLYEEDATAERILLGQQKSIADVSLGLVAIHPISWGEIIDIEDITKKDPFSIYAFSTLDELNTYPYTDPRYVHIEIADQICYSCSEGPYAPWDLLKEKEEIANSANTIIAGLPAMRRDGYSAAGGNLYRIYTVYLQSANRVTITARFIVDEFFAGTKIVSLSESMGTLLNNDFSDPVNDTIRLSNSTKGLKQFMEDFDAFAESLTYFKARSSEEFKYDHINRKEMQRDSLRRSDINTILNAIYSYTIDSSGYLPNGLDTSTNLKSQPICQSNSPCDGIILDELLKNYLIGIPVDPNATGITSGYTISIKNDRVTISAPLAETSVISVTR